jgi:cysteinyl-tRNA synthetase
MDKKIRNGSKVVFEKFDPNKYGKFTPLLNTEMKYYSDSLDFLDTFKQACSEVLNKEINFNKPEDVKTVKEFSKNFSGYIDTFLQSVNKLDETNIKELEGLDIPQPYKKLYLEVKKDLNSQSNIYAESLTAVTNELSKDLKELMNIVEKIPTRKTKAELDKDVKRADEIAKKLETYDTKINNLDKEINTKVEEINNKFKETIQTM